MTALLPPNSTPQEQAFVEAIDFNSDPSVIRGVKWEPKDSLLPRLLPWLIAEYGLGEILAWVPDAKRAIQDGIRFQRLRGTPASLRMALKWVDIETKTIEEEPPGQHFAEFQVGICEVPNNFFVENVVALAKLSAPARSRLTRLYNDRYDLRRFMLDYSVWGSLLSDYSGVRLATEGPVLSFGRLNAFEAVTSACYLTFLSSRKHHVNALSEDLYRLDTAWLGETPPHVQNYQGLYIRDHSWQNAEPLWSLQQGLAPSLYLSKALVVLSDSWELGDINACFSGRAPTEVGGPFILNEDHLSNHFWESTYQHILERFYRFEQKAGEARSQGRIEFYKAKESAYFFQDSQEWPTLSEESLNSVSLRSYQSSLHHKTASYPGVLTWHPHAHLNRPWMDFEPIVTITKTLH